MSDHDDAPDPIDTAYVRAEAALDDEAARAARRARVLAAVAAAEPAAEPEAAPARRAAGPRAGWLAAAGVAGLGLFLALQYHPPVLHPPSPAVSDAATAEEATSPPLPPTLTVSQAPPTALAVPRAASPNLSVDRAPAPAPPPMADAPPPQAFPAAPPPPPVADAVEPLAQGQVADKAAPAPAPRMASRRAESLALAPPAADQPRDPGERLRAAAAAGRTAELQVLLDQGASVDAPDADGVTALMKSVQAGRTAAAALLHRHGASLDRRDQDGRSARDRAADRRDPALDQALGVTPAAAPAER